MGDAVGQDFFGLMLQLHRFLAMGDTGANHRRLHPDPGVLLPLRPVPALAAPVASWRAWLTLDWRKKGRSFNWDLHSVFGTWCLVFYLLAPDRVVLVLRVVQQGLTKLLSDAPQNERMRGAVRPRRPAPVADYDAMWSSIYSAPARAEPTTSACRRGRQPATVFYLLKDSPHDRALNQITSTRPPARSNPRPLCRQTPRRSC
jgi:sulfite reductase (NADPH) flavoprotein alpha-component